MSDKKKTKAELIRELEELRARLASHQSSNGSPSGNGGQNYRRLFEANPQPMWIYDVDTLRFLAVNDAAIAQYGFSREEFLSLNAYDIRPDEDRARFNALARSEGHDLRSSIDWRHRRKDGTIFYVDVVSSALNFNGSNARLVIATDVTARKRAQQAVQESESRLAGIIDTAMDAIITVDETQTILLFNSAAERIFRCLSSEAVGKYIGMFIPQEFRQNHRDHLRRFSETHSTSRSMGKLGTLHGLRADGQEFPIEASISQTSVNGRKLFTVILRDVTDRIRIEEERNAAELALRESEERYRQFFEEDLTGFFASTAEGQLVSCNPAFLRIFGFASLEEATNRNTGMLYPSADAREEYLDLIRKKGRLELHEMELRRVDGKPVFTVETVIGLFDDQGRLVGLKGYVFDITERRKLEEQLLQSQKMEAVGQLASGIAHDFNNVMGVVLTASHLLGMKSSDSDILRYSKMIEEATLRGSAIAKQLLQFSRAEAAKLAPVSLSQTVLEAKKFLEHSFPKTIDVDVRINVEHGLVMADAGQVHQMILNLCINARDAILERAGHPTGKITISLEPVDGSFIEETYGWKSSDHYVLLSVTDNGAGIPEEIRTRIFDPFFTTKGIGKGTGLGLSIVHGIVKAHNAMLDVKSQEGEGTSFLIYIPAVPHDIIRDIPHEDQQMLGRGETILVIEDELMLLGLLKEFLVSAGYKVIEARDGEEGVARYDEFKDRIDLVLSDIGLPKMGGEQVFAAIRAKNPHARVIFCTGFIEEGAKDMLLETGALSLLYKPYKVPEVLSAVRRALDARPEDTSRSQVNAPNQ